MCGKGGLSEWLGGLGGEGFVVASLSLSLSVSMMVPSQMYAAARPLACAKGQALLRVILW